MITETVLGWFVDGMTALIGLIPDIPTPGFVGALGDWAADAGSSISGLGSWLPFYAVADVLPVLAICAASAIGIQVVRSSISVLTGGGGD